MRFLLMTIIAAAAALVSCGKSASVPDTDPEADAFFADYQREMNSGDFHAALDAASGFLEGGGCGEPLELLVCSYAGQAAMAADETETAYRYLDRCLLLWDSADSLDRTQYDYKGIITAYNALGIAAVNMEMDYLKAVDYLMEGMNLARKCSDYYAYAVAGLNLVVTCDLRGDVSGLDYALEIYDYGTGSGNSYILASGAYACTMMYLLKGDAAKAEHFLDEAVRLYGGGPAARSGLYCLQGRLAELKGLVPEAHDCYLRACAEASSESVADRLQASLHYGRFLASCGRCDEALEVLGDGIALAAQKKMRIYGYLFHLAQSRAYELKGDFSAALACYKLFQDEYSDIYDIEKERAVNDATRKYEKERYRFEMMKKSRELRTALLLTAVALTALAGICILYRHKDRMYTAIVRQYQDSMRKEKRLEDRITELEASGGRPVHESEKYSKSSLEEAKKQQLLASLERVMREEKVWRDSSLTADRLAKLSGTNRTYLSQVVNSQTGMTVGGYINSCRIDEAIAMLSDAANTIPLKALSSDIGFKSLTTFYKLFQERVGMTPAKYREKVVYLSKTERPL